MLLLMVLESAGAATIQATPQNYLSRIAPLKPGDTLLLAPGVYRQGLPLHGLQGEAGNPIVISGGNDTLNGTIFLGRLGANTVSIKNSAYLVVRSLVLDGAGLPVDAVKAEGTSQFAHHITLERLTIINHGRDQQIAGISTKCPAWSWVIRANLIQGAGTGIYLGNSDGSAPFIGGLIEKNLIVNSIGYDLQIKHQLSRPNEIGMPVETMQTVIRHNVFSKADGGSSGQMARPNVLLGHFPLSGAGMEDSYAVYGNFFYENPNEALLQAEGNVAIHDNIFFSSQGDAVRIVPHKSLPQRIEVEHNTVVAKESGIVISGADSRFFQRVSLNAVFAARPILGGMQNDNVTGTFSVAGQYLHAPFAAAGRMDFSPRADSLHMKQRDAGGVPTLHTDFFGRQFQESAAGAVAAGQAAPWHLGLAIQPDKP